MNVDSFFEAESTRRRLLLLLRARDSRQYPLPAPLAAQTIHQTGSGNRNRGNAFKLIELPGRKAA